LPGSRTQEVTQNLAAFVRTAEVIHRQLPETRFAVACFKPLHARLAREIVEKRHLPIEIHVGRTPELIHAADCCMAVSGSVSLELLYHTKPTVVLYSLSRIAFWVQNQFRRVKYITLVNLLATDELFPEDLTPYDPGQKDAEKVLFPEYLTCEDRSDQIAAHIIGWLVKPRQREALIERLKTHRDEIAHGGSSASAAEYILSVLRPDPAALPKPHFSDGARHGNPEMAEEELPRDSAIEASSSDPPSIPESKPGHRRDEAA
jgi:lipid-A-disaccharide synthase